MSTEGGAGMGGSWGVEAARRELKHLVDLFARDVELFDDFVDCGSGFEVFEYGGDWHPGVAKHPCAAQSAGYAFNAWTL